MPKKVTLGGERLGSGKKMTVELKNFGRSSHNLGCIIATDQAAGTLVPYYCDIATNGTTYYIDMATKVRTLPTNGPVFGSFKHQLDWFAIPIRLYIRALHNNALNIGMKMQTVYLPTYSVHGTGSDEDLKPEYTGIKANDRNIDQSCLNAYIGVRGLARHTSNNYTQKFPAIFLLAYWDIYKNYYANKQEEDGVVIAGGPEAVWKSVLIDGVSYNKGQNGKPATGGTYVYADQTNGIDVYMDAPITKAEFEANYKLQYGDGKYYSKNSNTPDAAKLQWSVQSVNGLVVHIAITSSATQNPTQYKWSIPPYSDIFEFIGIMGLVRFPLENIDTVREAILAAPKTAPYEVPYHMEPYKRTCSVNQAGGLNNRKPNAGLGVKTYLSDRFNNWLSSEWIEGNNGINEITAIDVSSGELKMDSLILQKKVFNMLNRIAVTDGTYDAWQEAVYGVRAIRMAETPIYCGGMSSEITFDEVVSNSATEEQPLGSLAGRGTDYGRKGGKAIKIKIEEPSMIMCIGSITPRVMYSQGNKWWTRLKTMNDLHKPDLDAIAWQDLLTDEMYASTTEMSTTGELTYKAIGKQPAWIEYTTRVNESFGSFAAGGELDWMVLNRTYTMDLGGDLEDATTYIDPTMYNVAFADTKLSARNFWVQVAFDVIGRRVMSARQIPNL